MCGVTSPFPNLFSHRRCESVFVVSAIRFLFVFEDFDFENLKRWQYQYTVVVFSVVGVLRMVSWLLVRGCARSKQKSGSNLSFWRMFLF